MDFEKAASLINRPASGVQYADVRASDFSACGIRARDGEVDATEFSGTSFGVRALASGSWGFASSTREADLEKVFRRAVSLALASKGKDRLSKEKPAISGRSQGKQAKPKVFDAARLSRQCIAAGKEALVAGSHKYSSFLSITDSERLFASSEGAFILTRQAHSYVSVTGFAREGSRLEHGKESRARLSSRADFSGLGEKAGEKAARMLRAKPCPKGRSIAVLDGELAGVLCHEAMGHACEADAVLAGNSILSGKTGRKVASDQITIIDDATCDDFGSFKFDDEGIRAQKKILVENGILRSFLHSRETAAEFKLSSTGNARAGSSLEFPVVRMSNTYFGKGKFPHSDIFDVRSGVYLKGMKGGSVDPLTGNFLFAAEEGFEIRNGELGAPLRDCSISGDILKTLLDVEAVGKDFMRSPGFCGKAGQSVPVSDGGPHMRIRNLLLG